MGENSKKLKFKSKYIGSDLSRQGRKNDSNYYRMHLKDKKISYIQSLAKNIDQVFIMSSIVEPKIDFDIIDRFLLFSQYHNIKPILFITKLDLEERYSDLKYSSKEVCSLYEEIGYEVYSFSNNINTPLQLIKKKLINKKTIIVGHSGVGKTTLLNKIDINYNQKVQEVSNYSKKGRHTTTKVRMHSLDFGGVVYDLPGLKELNFVTISKRELQNYFIDFLKYQNSCYFRDCLHYKETNCEVKKAVTLGEIKKNRYNSYLKILNELPIN